MLLASQEKRDQVVQPFSVRNLGVHAQQGFPFARTHTDAAARGWRWEVDRRGKAYKRMYLAMIVQCDHEHRHHQHSHHSQRTSFMPHIPVCQTCTQRDQQKQTPTRLTTAVAAVAAAATTTPQHRLKKSAEATAINQCCANLNLLPSATQPAPRKRLTPIFEGCTLRPNSRA